MASIRTAVVTLSPVIVDIITTLLPNQTLLNVVARLDDRIDIEARLSAIDPDLVLLGLLNGDTERLACALLARIPRSMIIALSNDCRDAVIHEMRPQRRTLRNISPSRLIRAIVAKSARSEN